MTKRLLLMPVFCLLLSACMAPSSPAPPPSNDEEPSAKSVTWETGEDEFESEREGSEESDVEPTETKTSDPTEDSSQPVTPTPEPTPEPADELAVTRVDNKPGVAGQSVGNIASCVDIEEGEDKHITLTEKPCDTSHQAQIVGYIDLPDELGASIPSLGRLQRLAAKRCTALAGGFVSGSISQRKDLTIAWTAPSKGEWEAGARTLVCMIAGLPSGDGVKTRPLSTDLSGANSSPATSESNNSGTQGSEDSETVE